MSKAVDYKSVLEHADKVIDAYTKASDYCRKAVPKEVTKTKGQAKAKAKSKA